jgi:hypothetical protein
MDGRFHAMIRQDKNCAIVVKVLEDYADGRVGVAVDAVNHIPITSYVRYIDVPKQVWLPELPEVVPDRVCLIEHIRREMWLMLAQEMAEEISAERHPNAPDPVSGVQGCILPHGLTEQIARNRNQGRYPQAMANGVNPKLNVISWAIALVSPNKATFIDKLVDEP